MALRIDSWHAISRLENDPKYSHLYYRCISFSPKNWIISEYPDAPKGHSMNPCCFDAIRMCEARVPASHHHQIRIQCCFEGNWIYSTWDWLASRAAVDRFKWRSGFPLLPPPLPSPPQRPSVWRCVQCSFCSMPSPPTGSLLPLLLNTISISTFRLNNRTEKIEKIEYLSVLNSN